MERFRCYAIVRGRAMWDFVTWRNQAAALRKRAIAAEDRADRDLLLMFAEDCEEIAAQLQCFAQPEKP